MPQIKIEGVPPYDGEYEIDQNFTNREFHTIKQVAGIRAGELQDAMEHQDMDLIVALAVNALRRAGHIVQMDVLWEAEAGRITLTADEPAAVDAVPPPQTASASSGGHAESNGSSGASGNGTGDHQESDPSRTGTPRSVSSAGSESETSAT